MTGMKPRDFRKGIDSQDKDDANVLKGIGIVLKLQAMVAFFDWG